MQVLYRFIGSGGGRGDDLYVSDATSLPPELSDHVDEKLLYLQPLYLACSHSSSFPGVSHPPHTTAARRELGLDPEGLYLGALNKFYKVTPTLFDAWCSILSSVPQSRLIFVDYNHYPEAKVHLMREAESRGVARSRLVFVPEGSHSYFMKLGSALDLFLDTGHPLSNGHTTVADMLYMHVPVLTFTGPAKPSRVASSLSISSGCTALVANSLPDYVSIARAALRPSFRASLGNLCSSTGTTSSPLVAGREVFDASFFARRWQRGLGM
eukprot:CAMPEP_0172086582 /NCGR_PEP_ID=MMETSP1043-20130122/22210_1 /TAXON_ID=464988 /ORGANISM="Hemiselmis andersenii, Strain CCMP441" /LENGTH=267 /DNA_ID=CAMNT_0012748695 /DNA_START=52 /DNA_END=852 /DNA_ORIENTATION=+